MQESKNKLKSILRNLKKELHKLRQEKDTIDKCSINYFIIAANLNNGIGFLEEIIEELEEKKCST